MSPAPLILRPEPSVEAVTACGAEVESYCGSQGADGAEIGAMLVALEEVLVNVVVHAHASWIEVRVECSPGWIAIDVWDDGPAFDPLRHPEPDISAPLSKRRPGGLGIFLAEKLTSEMTYAREGERNRVRLVRQISDQARRK